MYAILKKLGMYEGISKVVSSKIEYNLSEAECAYIVSENIYRTFREPFEEYRMFDDGSNVKRNMRRELRNSLYESIGIDTIEVNESLYQDLLNFGAFEIAFNRLVNIHNYDVIIESMVKILLRYIEKEEECDSYDYVSVTADDIRLLLKNIT